MSKQQMTPEWIDPRPEPLEAIEPICGTVMGQEVPSALEAAGFTIQPPPLTEAQKRARARSEKKRLAGFRL